MICVPNIQRIRCGANIRQRVEMQIVRQLASAIATNEQPPLWRTTSAANFVLQCSLGRHARDATGLSSFVSAFTPCHHAQFSSATCFATSVKLCSSFLPSQQTSPAFLSTGFPAYASQRFSSGLGCTTRIALYPRVTSFQPDQEWLERKRNDALCPGCGVEMQDRNPKAPGFFQHPKPAEEKDEGIIMDSEGDFDLDLSGSSESEIGKEAAREKPLSEFEFEDEDDPFNKRSRRRRRPRKGKFGQESTSLPEIEKPTVCARCHALRNYGKVKDESLENLLPDFDFEYVVGSRLRKAIGRRAVVVMVIDSVDFDGSFPRMAANMLAETQDDLGTSWQEGKAGNVPRLIIVLNKIDLLPGQVSPVRLEQWVRRRSRAGGVTQISGVHIVSAFKGWGIDKLTKQIAEMAGPRGDVWVIGAQNVGKSSLINALAKYTAATADGNKNVSLTEAALPGTTIGVLKLEGILPGKASVLDTPGLLHPHQITTRLTRDELKMVQIRKVLKPRTFRVKVGHSISLGGLARLTVEQAPGSSIYATVWASAFIPCHMGKAENAQELYEKHIGEKLQPPLSKMRVDELGRWVARTVHVSGDKWDKSSVDVAVAGVGWVALALSGSATLEIWTYEGVAVTVREAILLDLALVFERPGFTVMKTGKGKD